MSKGGGSWTDAERYQLMAKAFQQLESKGAKLDLQKLANEMPGRTPKAISHMITNIRKAANKGGAPSTPTKASGGRARSTGKAISRTMSHRPADDVLLSATVSSTSSKRKASQLSQMESADEADDADGDIEPETPSKKLKTEPTAAASKKPKNGKSLMPPPPRPAIPEAAPEAARDAVRETVVVNSDGGAGGDNKNNTNHASMPTATLDQIYDVIANAHFAAEAAGGGYSGIKQESAVEIDDDDDTAKEEEEYKSYDEGVI
ncbi:uncharacterized protein JN550_002267 [Neoarthrinium moseri]|uniref:uncharacterized protein n=1 Tax=Neoarthrinium moseri TaxID=1658444 RepID=UPI001FDAE3F8|nr:uncharacterized protein JN550_002267 [Neoarthrinium moseri]KAI1874838.1 hypothetical protein JN550_002267 [Neoarthrinium moseri]